MNKKQIILLLIGMFIIHPILFAQKNSLQIQKINKTKINYKAYVIVNKNLFALNDSGKLVIWNLDKLDTIAFNHGDSLIHYLAIAKDKNDNVFLGTNRGNIYKIEPKDFSFSLYMKVKYTIRYMCFNSANKLFLIVNNAVYEPEKKQYWNKFENHATGLMVTKRSFLFFRKKVYKFFSMPQYTFLDNEDRWWMTASYGEFGSDLQIFDTKNKVIVDNRFGTLNPGDLSPKSVFEDKNGNIYITEGLQHMINSGKIYRIDKNRNATEIFDGKIRKDTTNDKKTFRDNTDFVGPGAYNKSDDNIYFATSSGFYKSDLNGNVIKPQFLFNTNLSWDREPMAVGVAMSVIKLDFTVDNNLLFLTKNDGFGIYNGKSIVLFK